MAGELGSSSDQPMSKSYFATCTFDLKNGSQQDYQNAYADLAKLGFATVVVGGNGNKITLPTTTTAGEFTGTDAVTTRENLTGSVEEAFTARKFTYELFITVGGDWTWGYRTNKKEGK